jgi:heme-degrading monooxygenase HmoA
MISRLAQVNVARLLAPLDSELLFDFVASLDEVNASADDAPGFIWRLQSEEGNATSIKAFEWDRGDSPGVIINMSVWESVDDLSRWIKGPLHRAVLVQRRKWFERVAEATTALWWVSGNHLPSTHEAESKVLHLRHYGPTVTAFTFKDTFEAPDDEHRTPRGDVASVSRAPAPPRG